MLVRKRLPEASGSVASPRRITFGSNGPPLRGNERELREDAVAGEVLLQPLVDDDVRRDDQEVGRKLRPGTRFLWKCDQTIAIAITQVLPEPVAILKAKRRRSSGGEVLEDEKELRLLPGVGKLPATRAASPAASSTSAPRVCRPRSW